MHSIFSLLLLAVVAIAIILPVTNCESEVADHVERAKRAINPFLDSMGKRAVNPFLDSVGKRAAALNLLPLPKRYFDSLAGQSLGKRSDPSLYMEEFVY